MPKSRPSTQDKALPQALPIDGKFVLRVPKSDEEENRPLQRRDDHKEKTGQRRR